MKSKPPSSLESSVYQIHFSLFFLAPYAEAGSILPHPSMIFVLKKKTL